MSKSAVTTSLEERALSLLASGLPATKVAEALGVDSGRISKMVSSPAFSAELATAKYEALSKHNTADNELDSIESKIREQLLNTIDSVYKPMELTRILQVVNAAKRRGVSSPAAITEQTQILNLTMPTKIINRFVTNINNQVIQTGTTDLLTMQSSALASKLKEIEATREVTYHEQPREAESAGT